MGNELTQFQKDLIRMWDSLRTKGKGTPLCNEVDCSECPFTNTVCTNGLNSVSFHAEKAIEIVNQWAKEHPIITMRDKYKETFGVEPMNPNHNVLLCPKSAGFDLDTCPSANCSECVGSFWSSEYKKWEVVQND